MVSLTSLVIAASLALAGVNAAKCTSTVVTRMNWNEMTVPQQQKYVAAVKKLHAPNASGVSKLDEFGLLHTQHFVDAHQKPHTLPWHRRFLHVYENALQTVAADPTLFVPYWNWSDDSQNVAGAKVWQAFGHDGSSAAGGCVVDGNFANWAVKVDSGADGLGSTAAPAHCLKRNENFSTLGAFIAPEPLSMIFKETSYDAFRQRLEKGAHNAVHNTIGGSVGDMAGGWSCTDPIFWLHHAFIDKLWAIRQQTSGNPTAYDAVADLYSKVQPPPAPTPVSANDMLAPFGVTVSDTFSTSDYCYVYSAMQSPAVPRVAPKLMALATSMVDKADALAASTGAANAFAANATHNADLAFLHRPAAASDAFLTKWGMDIDSVRGAEAQFAKDTRIFNALSTLKGGLRSSVL
ncbi:hypothetical protein HKX48_001919 [Thoreauomyces humboldtii]|nr:hypothetical protein HKX48_001919 [Thoreauomyces humboldtii]